MATLTYVYSESTAVVGPLATVDEPHSWDLCDIHGTRITAPKGWEMVRYQAAFDDPGPDDADLTALAEAVRDAGKGERTPAALVVEGESDEPSGIVTAHRTGRRGHLRVLPDPGGQ